eukprot:11224-Chlamydomonas_euryale.AAC.2
MPRLHIVFAAAAWCTYAYGGTRLWQMRMPEGHSCRKGARGDGAGIGSFRGAMSQEDVTASQLPSLGRRRRAHGLPPLSAHPAAECSWPPALSAHIIAKCTWPPALSAHTIAKCTWPTAPF